jgi:transposase
MEAASFRIDIGYLYNVEAEIIANHLTPEQIKKRRAKKDVTDTLKRIRKRAMDMLADKHAHYSDMMLDALNYMMNGWDDLIQYRNDGRYTIDNMLAYIIHTFVHNVSFIQSDFRITSSLIWLCNFSEESIPNKPC